MKRIVILVALFLLVGALPAMALQIFADSFDDNQANMAGWKRSNTSYVTRNTGTPKVGDASLRIGYGGHNAMTYIKVGLFKSMQLSFKLAGSSLESADYLLAEYSTNNGSTWVQAAKLISSQANGTFRSYTVNIPNATVLLVRFRLVGGSGDYGYVDDVVLTGVRK